MGLVERARVFDASRARAAVPRLSVRKIARAFAQQGARAFSMIRRPPSRRLEGCCSRCVRISFSRCGSRRSAIECYLSDVSAKRRNWPGRWLETRASSWRRGSARRWRPGPVCSSGGKGGYRCIGPCHSAACQSQPGRCIQPALSEMVFMREPVSEHEHRHLDIKSEWCLMLYLSMHEIDRQFANSKGTICTKQSYAKERNSNSLLVSEASRTS